MVDIGNVFTAMSILFDGVQYKYWSKVADVAVQIVSGTLRLVLPTEVVESVTKYLGGYEEYDSDFSRVPCYTLQLDVLIGFYFSGVELRVPFRDLVFQSDDACYLLMEASYQAPYFIGRSILRSAYLVVDLESREVAIAQALHSNGEGDIEEIVSSIPLAVLRCTPILKLLRKSSWTLTLEIGKLLISALLRVHPTPQELMW